MVSFAIYVKQTKDLEMEKGESEMEYTEVFNDIIGAKCFECLSIAEHKQIDLSDDVEWKNLKRERERAREMKPTLTKKTFRIQDTLNEKLNDNQNWFETRMEKSTNKCTKTETSLIVISFGHE